MKKEKIFLGGPIQYAMGDDGIFDDHLKFQINAVLDILKKAGYQIFSAHEDEQFGKIDMGDKSELICQRDYNWMRQCDVFICILPVTKDGIPYRSDGTNIELGWGSALNKKIIILKNSTDGYSHLLTGLWGVSNVIYLDVEACIQSPSLLLDNISVD